MPEPTPVQIAEFRRWYGRNIYVRAMVAGRAETITLADAPFEEARGYILRWIKEGGLRLADNKIMLVERP